MKENKITQGTSGWWKVLAIVIYLTSFAIVVTGFVLAYHYPLYGALGLLALFAVVYFILRNEGKWHQHLNQKRD